MSEIVEIVERVARAIDPLAFHPEEIERIGLNPDRMRLRRNRAEKKARAAIEAMWQPTERMIRAAYGDDVPPDCTAERTIAELKMNKIGVHWRAMIDAALSPGEQDG